MRTESPVQTTFLANMARLWRIDPRLAHRVDALPVDASLEVVPSRAGPPTAWIKTPDDRRILLHSRYDPLQEAADFCKTLGRTEASCVILCGLGLGYHVKALREFFGNEISVLVGEPDLVTLKTAFENTDLTAELDSGRFEIITDLDKGLLHERLGRHSTVLMLGTLFAAPPASREVHADFHAGLRHAVTDYAAFAKMSLVTLVRNAAITCRNIANNLPAYLTTPPADVLRGRFEGCPAILVAAGPSLLKNIDQIGALRDKAVVIAAQTTLRPLLARGIAPHFVTSLDFSEISRQFFEGMEIPRDVVLVAEPKATWHVIDQFQIAPGPVDANAAPGTAHERRRVILLDNEFAHRCVGEDLARRTPMEAGATVMHLAYYLAEWMGCDPIIFVGQDLAFTGHCYYAPGLAIHRAWSAEAGRYSTLEMKEWERIMRHRPILRKVRATAGGELYADEQMFTYLEQFERDFAKTATQIIDATEGGAAKRGTSVMSLAEAAKRHCAKAIDAARFDYLKRPWHDRAKLSAGRSAIGGRLNDLAEFRELCDETRRLLGELGGLTNKPDAFNRRLVRIDELRALVQERSLIFTMVRDVSQLGELQRFAEDRKIAHDDLADAGLAQRQVQRDIRFIDSLLAGCDELRSILEQSLARFDALIQEAT